MTDTTTRPETLRRPRRTLTKALADTATIARVSPLLSELLDVGTSYDDAVPLVCTALDVEDIDVGVSLAKLTMDTAPYHGRSLRSAWETAAGMKARGMPWSRYCLTSYGTLLTCRHYHQTRAAAARCRCAPKLDKIAPVWHLEALDQAQLRVAQWGWYSEEPF